MANMESVQNDIPDQIVPVVMKPDASKKREEKVPGTDCVTIQTGGRQANSCLLSTKPRRSFKNLEIAFQLPLQPGFVTGLKEGKAGSTGPA